MATTSAQALEKASLLRLRKDRMMAKSSLLKQPKMSQQEAMQNYKSRTEPDGCNSI